MAKSTKTAKRNKNNAGKLKKGKQLDIKDIKAEKNKERAKSFIHSAIPFVVIVCAVFFAVCLFVPEACGIVGNAIKIFMRGLFGGSAYALPVIMIIGAVFHRRDIREGYIAFRILFALLCVINLSVILQGISGSMDAFDVVLFYTKGSQLLGGGVVGASIGYILHKITGYVGLYIISIILFVVATIFLCGLTPGMIARFVADFHKEQKQKRALAREVAQTEAEHEAQNYEHDTIKPTMDELPDEIIPEEPEIDKPCLEDILSENSTYDPNQEQSESNIVTKEEFEQIFDEANDIEIVEQSVEETDDENHLTDDENHLTDGDDVEEKPYIIPPLNLLNEPPVSSNSGKEEIEARAIKLVNTLSTFKVEAKFLDASHGPTVTRYELELAAGTKVATVTGLADDIALTMATTGVRIAPVPGKAAIGIEIPNTNKTSVYIRSLFESAEFTNSKHLLNMALGKDVGGKNIFFDLSKMPHLLVAGTTGSGKSVCINTMIMSILYRFNPDQCKIILIDPKQVEFVKYNSLPHLILPVVSDSKKAAGALSWAVNEMEHRYNLMSVEGVRDIPSYNKNLLARDPNAEIIPSIVIFIDEFADLMMTARESVENSVIRIAQKARAAGIHLVIGTQRPSKEVVTGLIKANFPSRIALTVSSYVDSKVMIDMAGAEKLCGNGDMLFAPIGAFKPERVQGAFVSDEEISRVVGFIAEQFEGAKYDDDIIAEVEREAATCGVKKGAQVTFDGARDAEDDCDPLLKQAIEITLDNGKAATSLLQRKLSIGYGRAAKIIDEMEQRGIVSAPEGNKPRTLLMTKQEYLEMVMGSDEN